MFKQDFCKSARTEPISNTSLSLSDRGRQPEQPNKRFSLEGYPEAESS